MNAEPVVVVGSGPSGASAAAQLVARDVDVVVLESGPKSPRGLVVRAAGNTLYRRRDWSLYSYDRLAPDSDPDVTWFSSLSLGGLSNYWTSAVPRFAPEDFTDGERLDERFRWPIDYGDLAPWYDVAERQLMVTAGAPIPDVPENVLRYRQDLPADWQRVAASAIAEGHGMGAMPMAKGRPWMVAMRGTEFSSYHCVIQPLERSPRLRVVRDAHVSELVHSPAEGRVNAVRYVDRAGTEVTVPCRAVVLAAGTVDSTIVALRSTSSDFPDGIGNSRGLVGRYLHDHPRQWWTAATDRPLTAPSHPIYIARTAHDQSTPMMSTSLTIGLATPAQRLRTYYRGRTNRFGVQVFGTMIPTPEIGIELTEPRDTDPRRVRPTIHLHYSDEAVANIVAARDRLRTVMGAAGIGVQIPGPFHELEPGSSVHFGGSLRMHADPRHGVVDRWNRMHDVPNVVVADMSCFTTGPEKNPTLTAMAIASRAADRLATDLQHPQS